MSPLSYKHHTLTGQSGWQDLLRLLKEVAVSDIRGKPTLRLRDARGYWYDRYRLGEQIVERYIGEDTEELRQHLARHETLRETARDRRAETSRLVRLLRSEGYLTPDLATGQILMAMARSGVFRLGGTVVGTHAFRQYEGVLGVRIGADQAAQTNDIDIASFERLSLALGDQVDPDLAQVFSALDFEALPAIGDRKVWRWRQTRQQTLIEFLTPSFQQDEGLRDLPALGVSAQSLHFLNYLIAEPLTVPLLYREGALIQIPRPERYAIHKLIVSERRRRGDMADKARKDRAQARFLIGVLADEDPYALAAAWQAARDKGRAWCEALDAALSKLPETAAQLRSLP
ncbi:nucleotidyltransferase family protein [Phaeovulum sp. W22_SRMD_FR3]|uniref:nucleotidyltransferase family protein n=1 Tax=Phaeovulum sp. W22_SRMD_FR3 TaxID=3240274 RepID=UPI003F99F291